VSASGAGSPAGSPTFGASAIRTPANAVTFLRLIAGLVMFGLVWAMGPGWGMAVAWLVLASTDGLDGFVARRQGVTRSGAFLDPLADKVLVLGVLAALVARGEVWWVPVALIALREVWMSLYRVRVAGSGVSVPARASAKVKTLVQDIAVGLGLLPVIGSHHETVVNAAVWFAAALTLWTGLQYLADARRLAHGAYGGSGAS